MDFIEKLGHIKVALKNNGYQDIADDILEGQMSGGPLGEVFVIVCSKLLWIKRRNKAVYKIIAVDVDIILDYAKSLKYDIIAKK